MSIVENIQGAFVGAMRPLSHMRGMGRISKALNRQFLKAGAAPIQVATMRDGARMRLDLRCGTEWFPFYTGRYDDAAITLIRNLLVRYDGDFLDVGGNIGMYSVRIATGLSDGRRSVCFEPLPANAARIRENARLNGVENRVVVHEMALSDTDGEAKLVLRRDFDQGSETGNASIAISDAADGDFTKVSVRMRRFDDVLAEMGEARFQVVKVDIEGHEDFFLRGAKDWLHRERPIILTEVNNWYFEKRGTTSSEVFSQTLPDGYEIMVLDEHAGKGTLSPIRVGELAAAGMIETCVMAPVERISELHQCLG